MSTRIGTSVGVWNENQIASLETGFSNFGATAPFGNSTRIGSTQNATIKPFYIERLSMRNASRDLGVNWSEYSKRGKIVKKYKSEGIFLPQLNEYWKKYLLRGNDWKNLNAFEKFISDQRLIKKAKEREEAELLARLKEEEKKKAISDSNLFPPDETELNPIDPLTDDELKSNYNTKPIDTPKKSNLLIYGVIGVVALVGIIILIKRK